MEKLDKFRVDRTVMEVAKVSDRHSDREYWLSKTIQERLEALEMLRQLAYGYDAATARLQRVLEVVKRQRR
ncbi:MAG: hypothetical protein K2X35_20325 [Bryobacteraceae bacterium]|nr:hypothetical protein [Bryobacteraceae bacterium]